MRGRKTSLVVVLTDQERDQLLRWSRSPSLPAGVVTRAQAVWIVAQGMPLSHTAKAVGLTEVHVRQWGKRFLQQRFEVALYLPTGGRRNGVVSGREH